MHSIRPATSFDVESLLALDHIAHTHAERRELIVASVNSQACYVAVSGTELLGYGVLNYSFYHQGFIDMLYVSEAHRRTGIGSALVEDMVQQCRTQKLFTSTNLSNLPMQALLKKLGFVVSGVIDNLDEGDSEIVFFKRLDK